MATLIEMEGGRAAGYGGWRRFFNVASLAALALIVFAAGALAAEPARIVMLGDSLTAGYGLPAAESLPAKLQDWLTARGHDVTIANAGVSGDTTAGGLARLDWSLDAATTHAIVALGANDGMRGIDPAETERNLAAIIERLRERDIKVLLAGILAPPNFGYEYEVAFNNVFPAVAERFHVAYYPFLLDGVAAQPSFNQADGIHPNREGVAIIVERLGPLVEELLNDP